MSEDHQTSTSTGAEAGAGAGTVPSSIAVGVPSSSGSGATSNGGADLQSKLEKANRLLLVAKRGMDDCRKDLVERDARIAKQDQVIDVLKAEREKLIELAKRAQQRIEEMELTLSLSGGSNFNNNNNNNNNNSSSSSSSVVSNQNNSSTSDDAIEVSTVTSLTNVRSRRRPIAALKTVIHEDCCWVLVRLEGDSIEWMREHDLRELYGQVSDLPFILPDPCIDNSDTRDLQAMAKNAKAEMIRVQDDYRRYRIRSDIARKQKEAELALAQEENLKLKQNHIVGQDLSGDLTLARQQIEKLSHLNSELELQCERAKKDASLFKSKLKDVEAIAEQWRWRYEQTTASSASANSNSFSDLHHHRIPSINETIGDAIPQNEKGLADTLSQATTQFSKLKREYETYRKRALQVVDEKEKELESLRSMLRNMGVRVPPPGTPTIIINQDNLPETNNNNNNNNLSSSSPRASIGSNLESPRASSFSNKQPAGKQQQQQQQDSVAKKRAHVDLAYLKNIVLKYMSSEQIDSKSRDHIEAAIATVLKFTPEEMALVKAKRNASTSFFGGLI